MNKKKALELIVGMLEEAMDAIDEINDNEEMESYYCKVRDIATDMQYTLDDME